VPAIQNQASWDLKHPPTRRPDPAERRAQRGKTSADFTWRSRFFAFPRLRPLQN